MGEFVIDVDDPGAPDVLALLDSHLAFARHHSPPEDVHAMDGGRIAAENLSFFSVRAGGELLGVGALRLLDDSHAELKSMHTAEAARRRGVGRAMVEHLVRAARDQGCRRVSIETGSGPPFAPARALYASMGFEPCAPFGDYPGSPNSVCMTRRLEEDGQRSNSVENGRVLLGVAHVGVCVPDVDEAVGWYSSVLGMTVLSPPYLMEGDAIAADMGELLSERPVAVKAAIVGFDRSDHVLELIEYPNEAASGSASRDLTTPGLSHVGLVCDDVDAERSRLEAAGVEMLTSEVAAVAGLRTTWFRDPWGVVFILLEKGHEERPYWGQWS